MNIFRQLPFVRYSSLLVTLFCWSVMLAASWGKVGDLVIDIGHEIEIPARLAAGQHLYSDVQAYYGPLPYYVNALALLIFGHHLEVILFIGAFLSFISCGLVFIIAKRLTDEYWAALCSICVIVYCAFRTDLSNFILPYSFGAVYATVFCLMALLAVDNYSKNHKAYWLFSAAALSGFAFLSKQEFGVAALGATLLGANIALSCKLQRRLLNIAGVILVASGCVILGLFWLSMYVSWQIIFASLFPASKAAIFAHSTFFQISPLKTLGIWWDTFKVFLPAFGVVFCVMSTVDWALKEHWFKRALWLRTVVQAVLGFTCTLAALTLLQKLADSSSAVFNPLGYLHWTLPALLAWFFLKKNTVKSHKHVSLLWGLLSFALLLNLRWLFYIGFYGLYATPAIILFFFCFYQVENVRLKALIAQSVLVCLSIGLFLLVSEYKSYSYAVQSTSGTLYTKNAAQATAFNTAIQYIQSSQAKFVLVLPEGSVLNFLTATQSPSTEAAYIPGVLSNSEEERKFVEKMNNQQIDQIVYVERPFSDWGYESYEDFNPIVHDWVVHKHKLLEHYIGLSIYSGKPIGEQL
jgi:hypothetical protein